MKAKTKPSLAESLEKASTYEMTDEKREEQRRSFAFGNANLANPNITREDVDRVADGIKPASRK